MDKPLKKRVLMLLENESYPEDCRVALEAEALVEAGYGVTVISPTGDDYRFVEQYAGTRIYRYPKPLALGGFFGYLLEYVYSILMQFVLTCWVWLRHGFDVIHVHTPPDMCALTAIFFQRLGKKFVFDLHDLSPELYQAQRAGNGSSTVFKLLLAFEKLACRQANRLIATNETQRRIQVERCGAVAENCYVVRNGPNEMFLQHQASKVACSTVSPGELRIGYVGVIGIQDGVDYLIRAFAELKKLCSQDLKLVVVGYGSALDGLRKLAEELNVSGSIEFTGKVPFEEVPDLIASFDICATPDPSNPYNDSCTTIKTMEYMALSKPTVCFDTRENRRTAGDSALYASENCIESYARALARLIDEPELREQLGRLGRARIDDGLTWAHQARNLVALYEDLFGSAKPQAATDAGNVHATAKLVKPMESMP